MIITIQRNNSTNRIGVEDRDMLHFVNVNDIIYIEQCVNDPDYNVNLYIRQQKEPLRITAKQADVLIEFLKQEKIIVFQIDDYA